MRVWRSRRHVGSGGDRDIWDASALKAAAWQSIAQAGDAAMALQSSTSGPTIE